MYFRLMWFRQKGYFRLLFPQWIQWNKIFLWNIFANKYFEFDGVKVKASFNDLAEQERYRTALAGYIKIAHGIIFVFDITNKETFDFLEICLSYLDNLNKTDVSKVLIGNKTHLDDENREVSVEEVQNLADKLECKYFEVSTETGENIAEAFEEVTRAAYNISINNKSKFNPIMLNKEKEKKKKNCWFSLYIFSKKKLKLMFLL